MHPRLCLCSLKTRLLNSLLSGFPKHLLDQLSKVQHICSQSCLQSSRAKTYQTLCPKPWLQIPSRIQYKISTLCLIISSKRVQSVLPWTLFTIHPHNFVFRIQINKNNKRLWRMSFFLSHASIVELIAILCSSLTILTFFQENLQIFSNLHMIKYMQLRSCEY